MLDAHATHSRKRGRQCKKYSNISQDEDDKDLIQDNNNLEIRIDKSK